MCGIRKTLDRLCGRGLFFNIIEFISFRGWEFIFQRHKGRCLGDISNHEAHEEHEGGGF